MDKNLLKAAAKLFLAMISLGTSGTLLKKASEDAGKSKLTGGKKNA